MRVLVCGGRDFSDHQKLAAVLDKLHTEAGIDLIIQGGAHGADELGFAWARTRGIPEEQRPYVANSTEIVGIAIFT